MDWNGIDMVWNDMEYGLEWYRLRFGMEKYIIWYGRRYCLEWYRIWFGMVQDMGRYGIGMIWNGLGYGLEW